MEPEHCQDTYETCETCNHDAVGVYVSIFVALVGVIVIAITVLFLQP